MLDPHLTEEAEFLNALFDLSTLFFNLALTSDLI